MKGLKQIIMMPAREQAAAVLREAILTKKLKEGEILTLSATAAQLGVSSTPIREAFQILEREGLIRLYPNKGATVQGINRKYIQDFYLTRAILESESVVTVCREKAAIEEIIKAFESGKSVVESRKFAQYQDSNQLFHLAIWNAAGNERIKSLLSSLWMGSSMGSNASLETFSNTSLREHEMILDAIVKCDADKAKDSMYKHIIRSMESILTRFE